MGLGTYFFWNFNKRKTNIGHNKIQSRYFEEFA